MPVMLSDALCYTFLITAVNEAIPAAVGLLSYKKTVRLGVIKVSVV